MSTSAATAPYDDYEWYFSSSAVGAPDSVSALSTVPPSQTSKYTHLLLCKGYDFSSIPSDATIVGVTCKIRANDNEGLSNLCFAKLLDADGAMQGNDIVTSNVTIAAASYADYIIGASNSVWGSTLTPAIVKDSDFGVAIAFVATTTTDLEIRKG